MNFSTNRYRSGWEISSMKNYANAFFVATAGIVSSADQDRTSKFIINGFAATRARTQKTISLRFAISATPPCTAVSARSSSKSITSQISEALIFVLFCSIDQSDAPRALTRI